MNSKHPRDKIRRNLEDDLLELTEFLRRPLTKGAAPGFCQALQLDVNAKVLEPTWTDQGKRWSDFPWVTLVLGSGPVGLPDVFWEVVELLPRLVNTSESSSGDRSSTGSGDRIIVGLPAA
jgi:hypothetical protein